MGDTTQWHLRPTNPKNPIVFFGQTPAALHRPHCCVCLVTANVMAVWPLVSLALHLSEMTSVRRTITYMRMLLVQTCPLAEYRLGASEWSCLQTLRPKPPRTFGSSA